MVLQPYNIGAVQKWFKKAVTTTTAVKIYRFISSATGTYVAATAAADCVTEMEVASGYDADCIAAGIVPVAAGDTCTAGAYCEIADAYGTVKDYNAGAKVGKLMSSGTANDLVLVMII